MAANSPVAFGSENMPVEIAATAKRYRISAVASFARPSPSSTTRMRRGSAEPAGDRQRRHHVRRRDNGAEQEADAPGQSDQVMRRGGDREGA